MHYYKLILKSEQNLTDQEVEEFFGGSVFACREGTNALFCFVSAINLEGTVEALTLNEEKQTEKLDFGAQDENLTTD